MTQVQTGHLLHSNKWTVFQWKQGRGHGPTAGLTIARSHIISSLQPEVMSWVAKGSSTTNIHQSFTQTCRKGRRKAMFTIGSLCRDYQRAKPAQLPHTGEQGLRWHTEPEEAGFWEIPEEASSLGSLLKDFPFSTCQFFCSCLPAH